MPMADPRMQAIAQLLMKGQNPVGRSFRLESQNPRGELSTDVLLDLLNPNKTMDLRGNSREWKPGDATYYLNNPPYQVDDQGEVVYETQEDAEADQKK